MPSVYGGTTDRSRCSSAQSASEAPAPLSQSTPRLRIGRRQSRSCRRRASTQPYPLGRRSRPRCRMGSKGLRGIPHEARARCQAFGALFAPRWPMARKLLENAALGPDQLSVVRGAFDGAWDVIKRRNGTSPRWRSSCAGCYWLTRHAVNYLVAAAARTPHMLRHSCGYALADKGTRFAQHAGLYRPPIRR